MPCNVSACCQAPVERKAALITTAFLPRMVYRAHIKSRYGEFSRDFVKMSDYVAREKAYAYKEHFNSSVNMAMSMYKLSFTSRRALMAARGWVRLILDRRRDLINDRPNCATAAEAPLDEAQER